MSKITILASKLDSFFKEIHTKLDSKVSSTDVIHVNGSPGQVPFFKVEGVPMSFEPGELVNKIRVANNQQELDNLKIEEVSFNDVYTNWKRISHRPNETTVPAIPAELDTWTYSANNGRITNTTNSASMIGFISPQRYSSYEMDVKVSSNNSDDDYIGLCLAFKQSGNREHTLVAMVDATAYGWEAQPLLGPGSGAKIQIVENMFSYVTGEMKVLARRYLHNPVVQGKWNTLGEVRIKAKRTEEGMLEVEALQGDGTPFAADTKMVVELPDRFKGPCQFGYVALSQPNSTWENISVPTTRLPIVDIRDNTLHTWTGSAWTVSSIDNSAMPRGRIYKDVGGHPYSTYYLNLEGEFYILASPGAL